MPRLPLDLYSIHQTSAAGIEVFGGTKFNTSTLEVEFGTLYYRTKLSLKDTYGRKVSPDFNKLGSGALWSKVKLRDGDMIMSLATLHKYDKIRANCFIQYSSLNSSEATEQYIGKVYIFFEHEYQGVIHYTALVQHCRTIDIRYGYKVVQGAKTYIQETEN